MTNRVGRIRALEPQVAQTPTLKTSASVEPVWFRLRSASTISPLVSAAQGGRIWAALPRFLGIEALPVEAAKVSLYSTMLLRTVR